MALNYAVPGYDLKFEWRLAAAELDLPVAYRYS